MIRAQHDWWVQSEHAGRALHDLHQACAAVAGQHGESSTNLMESNTPLCHLPEVKLQNYMIALLRFPLLGRPTAASNSSLSFEDKIQCYWAKFPTSVSLCALHEDTRCSKTIVEDLARKYTFVGPAPRFLTAELLGGCGVRKLQVQSLEFLRTLRDAVSKKFQVQHWLYSLQVNPCDFCHFASALQDKDAGHSFCNHARSHGCTSMHSLRWTMLKQEDELVKCKLSRLHGTFLAQAWHTLSLTERVYLARNIDWALLTPSQGEAHSKTPIQQKAIRRILRTFGEGRFFWVRFRNGYTQLLK